MVYRKINYGFRKEEITDMLRLRLSFREKLRYHRGKIGEFERKLVMLEEELNILERLS